MRNFKKFPAVADLPPLGRPGALSGPAAHVLIHPEGARLQDVLWGTGDGYEAVPVAGLGGDAKLVLAGTP